MCWWHTFLHSWNGLSLLDHVSAAKPPDYCIQTDASGASDASGLCRTYRWGIELCSRHVIKKLFNQVFLVIPPGVPSTVCNPTTTQGNYVTTRAGLDLPHLQVALQEYFANGAARSTWRTYAVGQRRYLRVCAAARRQAVPTTETSLMLFATHLATSGLAYTSIKVYLAAVRHLHVTKGKHSQFTAQLTPRLQQVLKGIKKAQAVSRQPAIRRPITPTILKGIRATNLDASLTL